MKKIRFVSILMAMLLLLSACSETKDTEKKADDTTAAVSEEVITTPDSVKVDGSVSIADMEGLYKTQGRTIMYDEGLGLLSTADAFEFNANCEGDVAVTVFVEPAKLPKDSREAPEDYTGADCYFTAYIDDVRSETRFNVKEGETELVIAEGLEKGEHNFRLVRQNEWEHARAYVKSVSLKGEITEAPEDKELYIEFIGDSIATGFGNLPEIEHESDWGGHPVWQDGTQAFAYMTAEELDADYSIVAIEGIGASCGYWNFTMNEIYDSYPEVTSEDYKYTPERTADIVVIELLSNDGANWRDAGLTLEDIFTKGIELAEMAKEANPNAKIIFSPGAYYKLFETRYNEKFGGSDNGYYCVDLPMDTAGKAGHPTVEGQTSAKDALVDFIKENIL
ncbi:MAG: hypothetical protein E7652_03825 [Ruminococcaceae bacterium]|nr:hypothetical protein [Oscillospiraceae bacterium]